ncbi:hypothetical protein ACH4A8_11115 [Streptomyces vietnamensis]|uniref:hypothetical protein n=1 Tax=Streptomyces vietnamensis TaxID=362257 RepID=UPI00378F1CAF
MRAIRHGFGAIASVAVLITGTAVAAEVRTAPAPTDELPVTAPATGEPENFGASCRTVVEGSRVTAHCSNPYPRTDRIRLHVECDRWWDLDTDSAPVEVGPADYAQVTGRCWKEVRSAWITHEPADPAPASPAPGSPPVRGPLPAPGPLPVRGS